MRRVFRFTGSLIALAFGLSSIASAQSSEQSGGQPDWLSQAKIVAQMEGISVGEAVRRAKLQQKMAGKAAALENNPDYAGSWIEQGASSFKFVLGFKNGKRPAAGTGDSDVDANSEFKSTAYSLGDMKSYQARLSKALVTAGLSASVSFDLPNNKVVVHSADAEKIQALGAAGTIDVPPFVTFDKKEQFFKQEATVSGGGPLTNGTMSCTASFGVRGTVTGIATANHCIPYGNTTHRGISLGTNRGGAYSRGVTDRAGRDFTWYRNDANTYNNAVLYGSSFYGITTVAPQFPTVGSAVCIIKQDGTQPCGRVQRVSYQDGAAYPTVFVDRYITAGGDSGGPWLYGSIAYGVHQGQGCEDAAMTLNCASIFSPAATMPEVLGVSVITG